MAHFVTNVTVRRQSGGEFLSPAQPNYQLHFQLEFYFITSIMYVKPERVGTVICGVFFSQRSV